MSPLFLLRGLAMLVLCLPAVSLANDDVPLPLPGFTTSSPPPSTVYRVDSRPPDVIFTEGFQPRGQDSNLITHLLGGPAMQYSGFVATTSSLRAARMMAARILPPVADATAPRRVWIYTIRATPRFFGVVRSLERAIGQLDDCEGSPMRQIRVTNLDRLLTEARREAEWVVYGAIAPNLILQGEEYALSDAQLSLRGPSLRVVDNPDYVEARSQGNTGVWLIAAMPTPSRAMLYRLYNQAQSRISALREQVGGLGAHWCLLPASTAMSRKRRAVDDHVTEFADSGLDQPAALALQHLNNLIISAGRCNAPILVTPSRVLSAREGDGSCQDPEAVVLESLPNGYVWREGRARPASLPWFSRSVSIAGQHWRNMPGKCELMAAEGAAPPFILCAINPHFEQYMVLISGRRAQDRVNHLAGPAFTGTPFPLRRELLVAPGGESFTLLLPDRLDGNRRYERDGWRSILLVAPIALEPGATDSPVLAQEEDVHSEEL